MRGFLCLLLLGSLALSACETMPWKKDEASEVELLPETEAALGKASDTPADAPLPLSSASRFRDIPLPENAKEDLDRSYIYESADLQIGRMVYTVKASINEVSNFYIKQMPAGGWDLKSVTQAEWAQLTFLKPGKRCEVQVKDAGTTSRGSLLIVHLTPSHGDGAP